MESFYDFRIAHRGHEPASDCSAVFPDCGFGGLSSPPFHRATGKSPEPAGWKTCATFRFTERWTVGGWASARSVMAMGMVGVLEVDGRPSTKNALWIMLSPLVAS